MNDHYSDIQNGPDPSGPSVLLIAGDAGIADQDHGRLLASTAGIEFCSPAGIEDEITVHAPQVVAVSACHQAVDHVARVRKVSPALPVLALVDPAELQSVPALISAGVTELHFFGAAGPDVLTRLAELAGTSHVSDPTAVLQRSQELLRNLCTTNAELSDRLHSAESELAEARSEVDSQVEVATTVSAFKALLSQELGVEGVLQTALEFVLGTTGPTNAAIFLADSETSYSLGAYVNSDCPREKADPVLNRFATEVCHHVAVPDDLVRFEDIDAFIDAVGPEAEILRSSEIIGMPCSSDGECLAVLFLFRPESESFPEDLAPTLDALRSALADQLATIVNIHHRIADHWPDESSDEAPDWGFGTGGNKAA